MYILIYIMANFLYRIEKLSSKGIPYIYGIHCNNYIVKRQTFAIDDRLLLVLKYMHIQFTVLL